MRQKTEDNRISYIKKPMARRSVYCLALSALGLVFFAAGMGLSIKTQGNIPLYGAAICFCSLLFCIFGLRYGAVSFKEKDRNYILAKIGIGFSGFLMILWLVTIMIGLKGIDF